METRLRELREDLDLTQKECAEIAYISKNSYIRYENNERIAPLDTIKVFAEYYNVSIDYIAKITDVKKPYPRIKNKI
ncbi:MAG: helix-turn-helix transcriptional regulator [Clostridia bacterium]|nr:helix-turn-helix transcriptional regulator [Clostridia bacterium]